MLPAALRLPLWAFKKAPEVQWLEMHQPCSSYEESPTLRPGIRVVVKAVVVEMPLWLWGERFGGSKLWGVGRTGPQVWAPNRCRTKGTCYELRYSWVLQNFVGSKDDSALGLGSPGQGVSRVPIVLLPRSPQRVR